MMMRFAWALVPLLVVVAPSVARGQDNSPPPPLTWEPVSMAGILVANAAVDSVFIDRLRPERRVGGGDWVSYLAARLDALPIPEGTGIRVAVDTHHILVRGKVGDLPEETRRLFGPIRFLVDTSAILEAEVVMAPTGPGVVRFVLTTISVNGYFIPESVLQAFLANVGRQYPVLTSTGRELLVAIPPDGRVGLVRNAVKIWIESPPPPTDERALRR